MTSVPRRHRFTVEEYYQVADRGLARGGAKVELIDGAGRAARWERRPPGWASGPSRHPDAKHYELVRGVPRVCELPGGTHGRLAMQVGALLNEHVTRLGLGTVLVETG